MKEFILAGRHEIQVHRAYQRQGLRKLPGLLRLSFLYPSLEQHAEIYVTLRQSGAIRIASDEMVGSRASRESGLEDTDNSPQNIVNPPVTGGC